MACHKHRFNSFDAIMDNPSLTDGHNLSSLHQKSYCSACMELPEDHGCSLCAEPNPAKSIATKITGTQSSSSYQPQSQSHQHIHRKPIRPEGSPVEGGTHHHYHHKYSKRIVLVKNSNPSIQKTILLHHTPVSSLGVFMDDVSELMQCLIKKLYTLDGQKIDSVQSLLQCPSILVCVGCEPFHPFLLNSSLRNSDDKLPRLRLQSQSNEEPRCKKNGSFGPNIKRSVSPERMGSFYQARQNMINDDIEKRVLVNKDGSLSMEMKVRFRLLNNETLHCSTEIKKSSDLYNVEHGDACCIKHGNCESCSRTESASAYQPHDCSMTNLNQKHVESPHFKHCCSHCNEYDICRNPAFVKEGIVRYITSSSSSASSHRIRCKKASVDSLHTMSSEEYTEQVVEKSTCVQQTVGNDDNTIVEYSTASRCCSHGEVCSVTEKTNNASYTNETSGQCECSQLFIKESKQSIPFKELQQNQERVQISNIFVEPDQEKTGHPVTPESDKESRNVTPRPHSLTPYNLSESPGQSLSPRTPSVASTSYLKSKKSRKTSGKVENGTFDERLNSSNQSKDVLVESNTKDEVSEVSSVSDLSVTYGNFKHDTEELHQTTDRERSSSDISTQSNAHENQSTSAVHDVEGPADITDNQERAESSMSSHSYISANSRQSKSSRVSSTRTVEANLQIKERAHSAMSVSSNASTISKQSSYSELLVDECVQTEDQTEEVSSALTPVSRSSSFKISKLDVPDLREVNDQVDERASSLSYGKSDTSLASPVRLESSDRVPSALSTKSNNSAKSNKSKKATERPLTTLTRELQERAQSAMSAKSNVSEISITPNISENNQQENCVEADTSREGAISAKSNTSTRSNKSKVSALAPEEIAHGESEKRASSVLSSKSASSTKPTKSKGTFSNDQLHERIETSFLSDTNDFEGSDVSDESYFQDDLENQPPMSANSFTSTKTNQSEITECLFNFETDQAEGSISANHAQPIDLTGHRTPSIVSVESDTSKRSIKSNVTQTIEYEMSEERPQSTTSSKTNISQRSMISSVSEVTHDEPESLKVAVSEKPEERQVSSISNASVRSGKSGDSKARQIKQTSERTQSALSSRSSVSERSKLSAASPEAEKQETNKEVKRARTPKSMLSDRPQSALSVGSNVSGKAIKTTISEAPRRENGDGDNSERSASVMSFLSDRSDKLNDSENQAFANDTETKQTSKEIQRALSPSVSESEVSRAPSSMSCKSKRSDRSDKSNLVDITTCKPVNQKHDDSSTEERLTINVSRTSIKSKKSVLSSCPRERPSSVSSVTSNISVRSTSSKGSKTPRQKNEDDKGNDLSTMKCNLVDNCDIIKEALVPATVDSGIKQSSAKSNEISRTFLETENTCIMSDTSRADNIISNKSCMSSRSKKSDISEPALQMLEQVPVGELEQDIKTKERIQSSMSVRSSVGSASVKSKNLETEDLNERSASVLSVESNQPVKSAKSKVRDENIDLERRMTKNVLKASDCVRFDCSSVNTPTLTETLENNAANEERPASMLSERVDISGKSISSSGHSTTEEDFTQASASVSIGIVEEYNVDSPEESSVKSKSSGMSCKVSLNINDAEDQSPIQTETSVVPKSHVSDKRMKSESNNSNFLPVMDTQCRNTVKSASTNRNRERKSPAMNDRPKSNSSNTSFHLEVNEQVSSAKSQPRSNSANLSESSKSQLIRHNKRKVNKSSANKSESKQSTHSNTLQQNVDDNLSELVPSVLPISSPTEVVNEWLRKIPLDSALYDAGDEFHEDNYVNLINMSGNITQDEKEIIINKASNEVVFESEIQQEPQLADKEFAKQNDYGSDITHKDSQHCSFYQRKIILESQTSAQLMRILLNPKLDRCNSLPEVSSVYGQKLSTSARGLLDCLVNLQLLDFHPNDSNDKAAKYRYLMNMLKSLWLCDPSDRVTVSQKSQSKVEQFMDDDIKVKSPLGMHNSSSSIVVVNENTHAQKYQTDTDNNDLEMLTTNHEVCKSEKQTVVKEEETRSDAATPDIVSRIRWTPENDKKGTGDEQIKDSDMSVSDDESSTSDSPREPVDTPLSNNSNENDYSAREQDTTSETTTSEQNTQFMTVQDADPVWVLNLLNKIEKQFMTHYVAAMAEFKVRWNLDDSEELDAMIDELKSEVHKMIQSSINKEIRKMQSWVGVPRPPKETLSRTSTVQTEKRFRHHKVMLNQSIDQPGENNDDYPSQPVLSKKICNSAPVMTNFDLTKIISMKNYVPKNKKTSINKTINEDQNAEDENQTKNVLLDNTQTQDELDNVTLDAADKDGKTTNEPPHNTGMCKAHTTKNRNIFSQETAEHAHTADIDVSDSVESIKSMAEDDEEVNGELLKNNHEKTGDETEEPTEEGAKSEHMSNSKMVKSQALSEHELEEEGEHGSVVEDVEEMFKAETAIDGEQKHDGKTEGDEAVDYDKSVNSSDNKVTVEDREITDDGTKVEEDEAKRKEMANEKENSTEDEPDNALEPACCDTEDVEETSEAETGDHEEQRRDICCEEATDHEEITENEREQSTETTEDQTVDDGQQTDNDKVVDGETDDETAENGNTVVDETDKSDISEHEETPTAKMGNSEDTSDDETEKDRELIGLNKKRSKEITESQAAEDGQEDQDEKRDGDTHSDKESDFEETERTEREEDTKTTEAKMYKDISDDEAKTDSEVSDEEPSNAQMEEDEHTNDNDFSQDEESSGSSKKNDEKAENVDTDKTQSEDDAIPDEDKTEGSETKNATLLNFENSDKNDQETDEWDTENIEQTTEDGIANNADQEADGITDGVSGIDETTDCGTKSDDDGDITETKISDDEGKVYEETADEGDKMEGKETPKCRTTDEDTDEDGPAESDGSKLDGVKETPVGTTAEDSDQENCGTTDGETSNVESTKREEDGEMTEAKTTENGETSNDGIENTCTADYTRSENGEKAGTLNEQTEFGFAENIVAVKRKSTGCNSQSTPEKSTLISGLVYTGESVDGGDESENESYGDTDEREQAIEIPAMKPSTWSSNKDDQAAESESASFHLSVKVYTGSEDGADADGEDSDPEVQTRNGNTEFKDNDCQCTCSRLHYKHITNGKDN